jgi:hypothetical protein
MLDAHGIAYMKTSKKLNLIDRLMADKGIWGLTNSPCCPSTGAQWCVCTCSWQS